MRVLMVCLGNICRSPTAEAALIEAAAERGLDLEIESAGTGGWHTDQPPDARMVAAAAEVGLKVTGRARQVLRADLEHYDLVLAMDEENLEDLQQMAGGADTEHLRLFRDFDPEADGATDVPDPYYGGPGGFIEVVEICRRTAREIVRQIEADELD